MFKDCTKLKRDVFVTWKENDVDEQNVDERKECWERKKVLSYIWVKSESDLDQISTRSLISFNQSWYTHNRFSVHLHSLKVSLQMTEHFSLIIHRLSLSDWWSKWTSQSKYWAISLFLLFMSWCQIIISAQSIEYIINSI